MFMLKIGGCGAAFGLCDSECDFVSAKKKVPAALSQNSYLNITAGCKSLLLECGWDGVCCVRTEK